MPALRVEAESRGTRYIIPPMSGMPAPAPAGCFSGGLGDDRLGGQDVLRDRRRVLQRRARDHRRIDDPGLDQVLVLAGVDVQALALRRPSRTLSTTTEPSRPALSASWRSGSSSARDDDLRARALVALERRRAALDRVRRVQERDAAAGDDALLEGRPGGLQRVLDAVLLLLHLGLGRSADLDHRDAAGELRQPLLQLLAVEVGVGVLDLGLELLDAGLDPVGARRHRR